MDLHRALFTYIVSDRIEGGFFSAHQQLDGLGLIVNHTSATDVLYRKEADREVAVIGLCVDAHGEIGRDEIPGYVLSGARRAADVYPLFDRFAGKYVVLYYDGANGCLFSDATASMQICYGFGAGGAFCAASTDRLAADRFGCRLSENAKVIRSGASLLQALPGDMTMYDEIKALLPNHYLDLNTRKAVRVPLGVTRARTQAALDAVAEDSLFLIRSTVSEFSKHCKMVCPLTSGYDSRLVFAFLKERDPSVQCYTFRHAHFSDRTDDVALPEAICRDYAQPYLSIPDVPATAEETETAAVFVGEYLPQETMNLAATFRSRFSDEAFINGNVIDQVGKSLLGNAVPTYLATPAFFQCKIHNDAKETRKELRNYLREIRAAGEWKDVFDLFAVENRCGRWASQEDTIFSVCGECSLNIFNCRELILKWISVPRKLRTRHWLHHKLFMATDARLLQYPFNPSSRTLGYLKSNWLLFYAATLGKQFYSK